MSFFVVVDLGESTTDRVTRWILLCLIIVLSTVLRVLWSTFYSSFLLKHLRAGKCWDLRCIIELKRLKRSLCKDSLRGSSIVLDHNMVSLESWKSWIGILIYSNRNMVAIQWQALCDRVCRSACNKEPLRLLEMICKVACFIVVIFVVEQVDVIIWRFERVLLLRALLLRFPL
jgi:hypothetical protein